MSPTPLSLLAGPHLESAPLASLPCSLRSLSSPASPVRDSTPPRPGHGRHRPSMCRGADTHRTPSILPSVWPPTAPLPFLHHWNSTEPELRCTAPAISPTAPSSFLCCTAAERLHCMAVISKSEHSAAAYHDHRLSSPPCCVRFDSRRECRPRSSTGGSSPLKPPPQPSCQVKACRCPTLHR
jgi:hypothetical protein